MGRRDVALLPVWERQVLLRGGLDMMGFGDSSAQPAPASTPASREWTREEMLTMTAEELGMV